MTASATIANAKPAPGRAGIGLRAPHMAAVPAIRPAVGVLEVHAENYMGGGPTIARLERMRCEWPVSVHGVGLSLGCAQGLDLRHLQRLQTLVARIEPCLVSEHLSWSGVPGVYLNDLMPLPYTEESLEVFARNIDRVQMALGRPVLVENPSQYLRFRHSPIPEQEFLSTLVRRTGCRILCDVNNIYVTTRNLGGDAGDWLKGLPADAVDEIHLAGHSVNDADGIPILIDDHGSRVTPAVWDLYAEAVRRFPEAATVIEWDSQIPPLAVLLAEAATADRVRAEALAEEPGNAVPA